MECRIVPYHPSHEPSLLALEQASAQGRHLRLEMLRSHFLGRSEAFEEYGVFLAFSKKDELLGAAAGSVAEMEWNGKRERIGFAYDLRVAPAFRQMGVSKALGHYLAFEFFPSKGIHYVLLTMKASNQPVARATYSVLKTNYHYPFSYLSIPTGMRLKKARKTNPESRFRVSWFGKPGPVDLVYRHPEGCPALFRTDLNYRIKVLRIAPCLNLGMRAVELFKGPGWKLPREGEEMCFASLFDLHPENLYRLNDLLEHLQQLGIPYLAACCVKGDYCYRQLRRLAINSMDYWALVNFPVKPSDSLVLDVRCL